MQAICYVFYVKNKTNSSREIWIYQEFFYIIQLNPVSDGVT